MKSIRFLPVLLALATGALAQDNSAKLELAHQVITATGIEQTLDQMIVQTMQPAIDAAAHAPAGTTPEEREKFDQWHRKMMNLSVQSGQDLLDRVDHLYADLYSEQELLAIKAFFTSPEGRALLSKQPQVIARLTSLVQDMARDLKPKVQQLVDERKK